MMWYLFVILMMFSLFCFVYGRERNSMPLLLISAILLIIISISLFAGGLDIPAGIFIGG